MDVSPMGSIYWSKIYSQQPRLYVPEGLGIQHHIQMTILLRICWSLYCHAKRLLLFSITIMYWKQSSNLHLNLQNWKPLLQWHWHNGGQSKDCFNPSWMLIMFWIQLHQSRILYLGQPSRRRREKRSRIFWQLQIIKPIWKIFWSSSSQLTNGSNSFRVIRLRNLLSIRHSMSYLVSLNSCQYQIRRIYIWKSCPRKGLTSCMVTLMELVIYWIQDLLGMEWVNKSWTKLKILYLHFEMRMGEQQLKRKRLQSHKSIHNGKSRPWWRRATHHSTLKF